MKKEFFEYLGEINWRNRFKMQSQSIDLKVIMRWVGLE